MNVNKSTCSTREIKLFAMTQKILRAKKKNGRLWYSGMVVSGGCAPRPCPENLIVPETKTSKQTNRCAVVNATHDFNSDTKAVPSASDAPKSTTGRGLPVQLSTA